MARALRDRRTDDGEEDVEPRRAPKANRPRRPERTRDPGKELHERARELV